MTENRLASQEGLCCMEKVITWALVLAVLNFLVVLPESKMGLRKIVCEDGRWMELAEDRVQRWALVLEVLNRCVLLPQS